MPVVGGLDGDDEGSRLTDVGIVEPLGPNRHEAKS